MYTVLSVADEPDKFDDDFNESESEEEDDDKEETTLRKNERAAKVWHQDLSTYYGVVSVFCRKIEESPTCTGRFTLCRSWQLPVDNTV